MGNVIITGATGALGHALIDECIAHNDSIYVLCRKNSKRMSSIQQHPLIKTVECDLSELIDAQHALPDHCDVFYHFGWSGSFGNDRNDVHSQEKNIRYTLDAVELAQRCNCHTFVGAGSQAEYGRVSGKIGPETPTFPENGYGITKLCAGQLSRLLAHQYGMKHIWTRILSIYGPYDRDETMVMSTIIKLMNGEPTQFTPGEQMWDYIYSKDAGKIMYALGSDLSVDGRTYVIGSGEAHPLREYIEIIKDIVNPDAKLGFGEIPYNDQQVMYLCADNSDIKNDLNYSYKYCFDEGIKDMITQMKEKMAGGGTEPYRRLRFAA